jgi:hypothetical protein
MPAEYETNCLHFRKESKLLTLTIQINFIPWFWKDLHPAIPEAPLWCFIQPTFSHAQGCVFCVSAANLWTNKHMPVMSEWKHWWVSVPQWEHILWTPIQKIFSWSQSPIHPEFSCNWQKFKCMLLQEQSCGVSAFTYCTVVLAAATSRPTSSTFHYNHIHTYISVEYVTAFQHIQNLSSINPLLMWHPQKT